MGSLSQNESLVRISFHEVPRKTDTFTAEFSTKNIQDDLVKLLASSSMPSTSSADASTLIRQNCSSSFLLSQLISSCCSSIVSTCRPCSTIMPRIIPFPLFRSIQPRRIHHPYSRSVAIYAPRCQCTSGIEPCGHGHYGSKLGASPTISYSPFHSGFIHPQFKPVRTPE